MAAPYDPLFRLTINARMLREISLVRRSTDRLNREDLTKRVDAMAQRAREVLATKFEKATFPISADTVAFVQVVGGRVGRDWYNAAAELARVDDTLSITPALAAALRLRAVSVSVAAYEAHLDTLGESREFSFAEPDILTFEEAFSSGPMSDHLSDGAIALLEGSMDDQAMKTSDQRWPKLGRDGRVENVLDVQDWVAQELIKADAEIGRPRALFAPDLAMIPLNKVALDLAIANAAPALTGDGVGL